MDSLIDSMMLVEEEGDDNGDQKDMFKVHHLPNPAFQRHFQVLLFHRYSMRQLVKFFFSDLELHQLFILNQDCVFLAHCLTQPFCSVSAPSGGEPRRPSPPHGALAEGRP